MKIVAQEIAPHSSSEKLLQRSRGVKVSVYVILMEEHTQSSIYFFRFLLVS